MAASGMDVGTTAACLKETTNIGSAKSPAIPTATIASLGYFEVEVGAFSAFGVMRSHHPTKLHPGSLPT
jgi:hypothetical protein